MKSRRLWLVVKSRRLSLGVLVNWMVMKLTMRRNYMRMMTMMLDLLVKNLMRFPGLLMLRPLLEDMSVKITILYVITLGPILLDLPVIWPWVMIPHWVPSVSTLYVSTCIFAATNSFVAIRIFCMMFDTNSSVGIRTTRMLYRDMHQFIYLISYVFVHTISFTPQLRW